VRWSTPSRCPSHAALPSGWDSRAEAPSRPAPSGGKSNIRKEANAWSGAGLSEGKIRVDFLNQVSEEALLTFCRERLADYKVPARVILTSNLPMTPLGKIHKIALKENLSQYLENR